MLLLCVMHDTHFGIEHIPLCTAMITIHFISDQSEILVWSQEVTTSSTNKSTWSAHGKKNMTGKGKKVVMLIGQMNRWRVSSICMIMSSLSGFFILVGTICKQTAWNVLLDSVCKLTRFMIQQVAWYKYRDTCFTV